MHSPPSLKPLSSGKLEKSQRGPEMMLGLRAEAEQARGLHGLARMKSGPKAEAEKAKGLNLKNPLACDSRASSV